MKSVYELTKKELKEEEKLFTKTAYGKKLNAMAVAAVIINVISAAALICDELMENETAIEDVITSGVTWLCICIGGILVIIANMIYHKELKKYIESKNK